MSEIWRICPKTKRGIFFFAELMAGRQSFKAHYCNCLASKDVIDTYIIISDMLEKNCYKNPSVVVNFTWIHVSQFDKKWILVTFLLDRILWGFFMNLKFSDPSLHSKDWKSLTNICTVIMNPSYSTLFEIFRSAKNQHNSDPGISSSLFAN